MSYPRPFVGNSMVAMYELVRTKKYFHAELTVAINGIQRNELVEVSKVFKNGIRFLFCLNIFDAPKYDIVSDLVNSMSPTESSDYLSTRLVEIIVDMRNFNANGSQPTVLNQLDRLASVLNKIQNLSIRIEIAASQSLTKSKKHHQKSTRAFLLRVVQELRSFASLKYMEVVLAMPEGMEMSELATLTGYGLPFYELETMTTWKVKFVAHGKVCP
ncbi:hypothetical protein BDZ45DRAFT_678456 [Acephala macrosclerotiorum]|nr:hypothetical protein BDZ45DRAFT_678456 [Acephala macrosclerotiorum]